MSMYEVFRGLRANGATRRLAAFQQTVASSDVFSISTNVLMRAAELWAEAQRTDIHEMMRISLLLLRLWKKAACWQRATPRTMHGLPEFG
ncbi:MAG TPA: hypothetical protein PLY87_29165 [Planctomycetaceae bacterium]|nr:hypothetical protein [Planctomycetaceae bacterium]